MMTMLKKNDFTRRLFRLVFRLMAYRPPVVDVPPQGVTLAGVTVVNPGDGRHADRTVVVKEGQIHRIERTTLQEMAIYQGDPYIGSYILPGLVDMHVHFPPAERALANLLFLVHGVTSVRETGDADGSTWRGRRLVQEGKVPGPRIFASGPVLDGDPPFLPTSWVVHNASEAEQAVGALEAMGADWVKVQHMLSPRALAGIREAAKRRGLPVAGHIPIAVPFAQAQIQDVQHLDGMVAYPESPDGGTEYQRRWSELDRSQIDAYVQVSVDQRLIHTPTLVTTARLIRLLDTTSGEEPAARLVPRYYREVVWNVERSLPSFRLYNDKVLSMMRDGFGKVKEVVRRLYLAGVRLHLGTDTPGMPYVVPGASLHEELALMVSAGLSLEAAWMAGTRDAGMSLGLPLLGTVKVGAPADLLIFGQDPTRDLAGLSTFQGVVAQGRLYTRDLLEESLARHRQRFERPLYDRLSTSLIGLGMRWTAAKSSS
jgi:hypothetical protein